jgi:hypothetical protein
MRFFSFLTIIFSLLAIASSGSANPVSCDIFRARQVDGSQHVQITFGDQCDQEVSLTGLFRDEYEMATDWQGYDGFVANTGSGPSELTAKQMCDCDLSVGSHSYRLAVTYKSGNYMDFDFPIEIEIVAPQELADQEQDTEDAGPGDYDEDPWNEPEPTEIQGLNCIDACASGGSGTEAAAMDNNESGCSMSGGFGSGSSGLAWAILILGLMGFVVFRRKPSN